MHYLDLVLEFGCHCSFFVVFPFLKLFFKPMEVSIIKINIFCRGPPSVSGQQSQKQLSAPPTPSQSSKPLSPQKVGQALNSAALATPRNLPSNCPPILEDIVYGLICIIQCVTMECPGSLVWYPPDDATRIPGSPLDYLPVAPSLLPLPFKSDSALVSDENSLR